MRIEDFIKHDLLARLQRAQSLVVYDADRRYRELCAEMAVDGIQFVDASESSIESRLEALRLLKELGNSQPSSKGLVVYVPAKKPITDEQKQIDPFSVYMECAAVFPEDDGDEYSNLCLRAKPDHATEIRRMFGENPSPSFEMINAIGAGVDWPQLRATLKVESARDILMALLVPMKEQLSRLKIQEGWAQEAREFLKAAIGLNLKSRGKAHSAVSTELWRYVLFSEFVFDLPGELPRQLIDVPRAKDEARPVVEDICDRLRSDVRTRPIYIEKAESIAAELDLREVCSGIDDLGVRDTFLFEERTFLRRAINGIMKDETDVTRRVLERQLNSVWLAKGEIQAQWTLIQAALHLIEACNDLERQFPEYSRTQSDLLDFYIGALREADRLQREFEQSYGSALDQFDLLTDVVEEARARYRRLIEKVQTVFTKHLQEAGWPPAGRLANADVYDRFVGARVKERGRKVAYFMVDALRYELGVALEKLLSEDGQIELHAAFAQLPTITPVGMASLLPEAKSELFLDNVGNSLVPKLAGITVSTVPQRMEAFRKRLGDRFHEISLNEFVRRKIKLPPTAELLVLRSVEIDSHLESNPETTLKLIPDMLTQIRVALHKLRNLGFAEAVIAADHGFFLNAQAEAGDVCVKPKGAWPIIAHDRLMLGNGEGDSHNFVMPAERLGIRGAFAQAAGPKTMAPYRSGHLYFHGGISLSEAVVPVLIVRLEAAAKPERPRFKVQISYKDGAKKITTRLPVIQIEVSTEDLFSQQSEVEILLEAQDENGNVVGEPRGGDVNPATRTISLMPGTRRQIALNMDQDFEGKFAVKALNPTTLASYDTLNLETDYTV